MNYTDNYSLPQWEEEDRIQMADFNDFAAKVDAGLAETPYVIGSYRGDGATAWRTIEVGFKPRFVIITAQAMASTVGAEGPNRIGIIGGITSVNVGYLTATGFQVRASSSDPYPALNNSSTTYYYIAFK
jgi:hypothetical protein